MRMWILVAAVMISAWAQAQVENRFIRVLTYNVWGVPLESSSPFRKVRMPRICERLQEKKQDFDIVLIQEAWDDDDQETLKKCGFSEVVDLSGSRDLGLLILSQWKVIESRRLTFSENGYPENTFSDGEALTHKGAIAAKIATPQGQIWVVNTHLVADYSVADSKRESYEQQRTLQTMELADFVHELQEEKLPVILGGDLNFGPSRLKELLPQFVTDVNADHLVTYPGEGKIDHLLSSYPGLDPISSELAFAKVENLVKEECEESCSLDNLVQMRLSDHLGLVTVFVRK